MPDSISSTEKLIDLSAIGQLVRRHRLPMMLASSVVMVLALAAFVMAKPIYSAQAVIGLGRTDQAIVEAPQDRDPRQQVLTDSPQVDTEVQVLQSSAVAESAVRAAQLNSNEAFIRSLPKDAQSGAVVSIEAAAAWLGTNLRVERQGVSYAIGVKYRTNDPQLAATVANAVASAYVSGQVDSKVAGRSQNIKLLQARMEKLRSDVIAAESAVAKYQAENGLVAIADDNSIAQQQLATLNAQLAQARADLGAAAAQARANSSDSGTLVNNSSVVGNLRLQQAQLASQQAELAKRYGPLYPDRLQIEEQLSAVNSALARETSRISAGVSGDVQAARERVGAVEGAIAQTRGQLATGNSTSVRLNELKRIADSTRLIYQAFLDRYRVELAAQGTERGRAYIIASALAPTKAVSPDPVVFMLGGLIAALVASGLTAMYLEWRERGLRTRAEAEDKLQLPVLASIPDLSTVPSAVFSGSTGLDVADYLVANDGSVFNEAFRSIRTALKLGQAGQVAKIILVTSAIADEGKTTASICLARSAAMAGHRTLLIDADVRRHSSSRSLTSAPRVGLVEVLQGRGKLEDAILQDNASGAFVLPQAPATAPAYDALQSAAMSELLRQIAPQFDLIVLDTAPVLAVAETRALSAMVDSTLLVARWRKTSVASIRAAIGQLERAGGNILGTVLTQVDVRATAALAEDVIHYQSYDQLKPA